MSELQHRPTVRIKTINHIGIPITDRKRSLPFYRDLAGLELIPAMEDGKSLIWTGKRIKPTQHRQVIQRTYLCPQQLKTVPIYGMYVAMT